MSFKKYRKPFCGKILLPKIKDETFCNDYKSCGLKNFDISNKILNARESKDCNQKIGVVGITTAQLHSTKPELRFCAGSNPARGVSEIRDGEDL